MAKYSEQFKVEAVRQMFLLKSNGMAEVGGVECYNVRELVKELGISSYTIYQWNAKVLISDERNEIKTSTDLFEGKTEIAIDKAIKNIERIGFGISFWSFVAKNMGIKNYRVNLNQLKLKIGMELIKETGLINNNLVREKLRLNE